MIKNKKTKAQVPKLPKLVTQIISPELKHLANYTLKRIGKDELATLKKIVKGTLAINQDADMGKAILALAQRESSSTVAKILGDFLTNKNVSKNDKVIAANSLTQMPSTSAEKVLLENLSIKDSLIRNSIIRSLGAVGGKDALARLHKLSTPKSPFLKKQLQFSKTLIAHRLNDPKDYLKFEKGKERRSNRNATLLDFSVKPLSKNKILQVVNSLSSSNHYNIKISENLGSEIIAGNATWVFLVNKELNGRTRLTNFSKRKYLVGLLARKNKSHQHYAIQYIVLSNPKARGVQLMIVRTDGEVFYSGNALMKNGQLQLSIQDIDRPGTMPTNIEGHLTIDGFKVSKSILFGKRNKKKGAVVSKPRIKILEMA